MKKLKERLLALPTVWKIVCLLLAGGGAVLVVSYLIKTVDSWFPAFLVVVLLSLCIWAALINRRNEQQKESNRGQQVIARRLSAFLFGLFQNPTSRELYDAPITLIGVQNTYDLSLRCNIIEENGFPLYVWELDYRTAPEYQNGPRPQGIELEMYLYSSFNMYATKFIRSQFPTPPVGQPLPQIFPVAVDIINDRHMVVKLLYADTPEAHAYIHALNQERNWLDNSNEESDDILF